VAPGTAVDLSTLNPDQRDAVLHRGGPLLVLAGAGSGKTRVLTHRIAHLISTGVDPLSILAITFTNKAADEMRQRVASLVGRVADRMWVSTFHSACVRILRPHAEELGYPRAFTIYDASDSRRLVGQVVDAAGLDPRRFPAAGVQARISRWKNELMSASDAEREAEGDVDAKHAEVYRSYQRRLVESGAMDFDDLLVVVVRLFRSHPEVLRRWQDRFSHVLIDEYQDTNVAQNQIVTMLGARHHQVCVVGDADQSIYRFRGADFRNILDFEDAFPDATTIVLDQNYRSTQTILDAANAVITHNAERKPKNLWTDRGAGEPIVRYFAEDAGDEARFVAGRLRDLHDEGRPWTDLAVLYRTNAQSRMIEEALMRDAIPYKVIGGTRFYDRREVRDAVAYLRVAVNPLDEMSIRRVVNVPRRGIGDTSLARVVAHAERSGLPFAAALRDPAAAGVSGTALRGIGEFWAVVDRCRAALAEGPAAALEVAMEESGYLTTLAAEGTIESEGREENVRELIEVASEFESAEEFLEKVSLVADTDEIESADHVTLMTLHAAKGLEYPVVFIVGFEEGIFPHSRALTDSHAWSRVQWGNTQYNPPSRFLSEIPQDLVQREGEVDSGADSPERADVVRSARERAADPAPRTRHERRAIPDVRLGDDVEHPVFGEGVVVEMSGSGDSIEVTVRFSLVGTKRLALAWAPLTKLRA
jgi:DNA helicase-2/ATP-dependent DNA helicase PcrA